MITAQHVGILGNTQVPTEWLAGPGTLQVVWDLPRGYGEQLGSEISSITSYRRP